MRTRSARSAGPRPKKGSSPLAWSWLSRYEGEGSLVAWCPGPMAELVGDLARGARGWILAQPPIFGARTADEKPLPRLVDSDRRFAFMTTALVER